MGKKCRVERTGRKGFGIVRPEVFLVLLLILGAGLCFRQASFGSDLVSSALRAGKPPVRIGALVPRSGDMTSIGEMTLAAMNISAKDLERLYTDSPVELVVEDTGSEPQGALPKLEKLVESGIRVIVGPYSSSQVAAVKAYADSHEILLISPASTAPSLALDDNIFRLVLDDNNQASGIAELLARESIACVVPVYRNDVYGRDLYTAFQMRFSVRGGMVVDGVSYEPGLADPEGAVSQLTQRVSQAVNEYGRDAVAVLMISFDEGATIMQESGKVDLLGSVRWFGTDTTCRNEKITSDAAAAAFALKTHFTAPVYDRDADSHPLSINLAGERLKKEIAAELGYSPNGYVYAAYDAVMLAGLTDLEASAKPRKDLKAILTATASTMRFGTSSELDANGDVKWGSFGFYRIESSAGQYTWALVAAYHLDNYYGTYLTYRELSPNAPTKDLEIGALLPMTGAYSGLGGIAQASLQEALADVNSFLGRCYPNKPTITLAIEDTQSDPAVALAKLRQLKESKNIRMAIGPFVSDELEAVMNYADANDILIASPTSPVSSLALGDNTFRLFLNNQKQAQAVSLLMDRYNHEYVIPVFVDIPIATSFVDNFRTIFQEDGKDVDAGISYDWDTADFDSIAADLAKKLKKSIQTYGRNKVSILLYSFTETKDILHAALRHSALSRVRWYGVNEMAKDDSILEDPSAVSFAKKTHYTTGAMYSMSWGVKNVRNVAWDRLTADLQKIIGGPPDAPGVSTYESLWLCLQPYLYLAWDDSNFAKLRQGFITTTNGTDGYLGPYFLDEAGDRSMGSVGFFSLETKARRTCWKYIAECYFTGSGPVLSVFSAN